MTIPYPETSDLASRKAFALETLKHSEYADAMNLRGALITIITGGYRNEKTGICGNLSNFGLRTRSMDLFTDLATCWPKFYGDISYPIPGRRAEFTYHQYKKTLWIGQQKTLRHELCQFVLDLIDSN